MNRKDILLATLVIVSWGIHIPVIKIGTNELSGLLLLTIRMFLTGIVFLPFCKNLTRTQFKEILFFTFFFYIGNLACLFLALKLLPSATVALLIQMQVPFAMIVGRLLYKEKIGRDTLLGLIIAFIGIFLIFGSPAITNFGGAILTAFCCLSWAIGSSRMRYLKDVDMASLMAYPCILATPVILSMTLLFENNHIGQLASANWTHLVFVFIYQVFLMSLMSFIWKELLSRNPVQYVTSFALLQPVSGVVASHLLLGEILSSTAIVGGTLALFGVATIMFKKIQSQNIKIPDPEAFSYSD